MIKQFTSLILISLLLIGCGNTVTDEANAEETEDLAEVSEEDDVGSEYFVDNLQTTFAVTPTKLPKITEQEIQLVRELEEYVNELSTPDPDASPHEITYYSDRELVDMSAVNFPEYTSDELFELRSAYYASIFYGDFNEIYIDNLTAILLEQEVLESNLMADENSFESDHMRYNVDYSMVLYTGSFYNEGERSEYKIVLEYNDDYTEASMIRLAVNGEEAFEKVPAYIPTHFNN